MTDYGEPWKVDYEPGWCGTGHHEVLIDTGMGCFCLDGETKELRDRIVACVNACAGIRNPAAIPAAIGGARKLLAVMDKIRLISSEVDEFRLALAKLDAEAT